MISGFKRKRLEAYTSIKPRHDVDVHFRRDSHFLLPSPTRSAAGHGLFKLMNYVSVLIDMRTTKPKGAGEF